MKSIRTGKNNPFLVFGIALLTVLILSYYQPSNRSKNKGKVYQVFYQIESEHTLEVAQALTDKLSKNFHSEDFFSLILSDKSTVEILSSSSGNRSNIEEVFEYLTEETEFDDQALIQGVQMCLDRIRQDNQRPVHCIFITPGTSNPSTIKSMRYLWEILAKEQSTETDINLYFLGLEAENRQKMATSVEPMGKHVQFAVTDSEINQKLGQF